MTAGGRAGAGALGGLAGLLAALSLALWASPDRDGGAAAREREELAEAGRLARELTPRVARRVERIRELEFDRVPSPRVVTAQRFAEISARAAELGPRARRELADGEATARLLGLMEPGEQLDPLAEGASELAAAAYDPQAERLYVIFEASGNSPELLEFLLAHELDHALADQRFGIAEPRSATDDGALAALALIEGSATSTMSEYAARHLDPLALGAAAAAIDADSGEVPEFYVEALTWTYLGGSRFVEALRGRTGDWRFVDAGFERLPASTEQVLRPASFLSAERPREVVAGPRAVAGWTRADTGVLGELGTAQVLRLGAPAPVADEAASGWEGDAYALYVRDGAGSDCEERCRAERALAVAWLMEGPQDARELELALAPYLSAGLGGERSGRSAWELDGGWAAIGRRGSRVTLGLGPDRELAEALVSRDLRRSAR